MPPHEQTRGYVDEPTVDDVQLVGIQPSDFAESVSESRVITTLRDGSKRSTLFFRGAGFPDLDVRYSWRAGYSTIARLDSSSSIRRTFEGILSDPAIHQWSVWRHVSVSYSGNGNTLVWFLPFSLATSVFTTLPKTDPLGERTELFASKQLVGDNVGLDIIDKTAVNFDAGTPLPTEVWVDIESVIPRVKTDTTLTVSERLYVSFVPAFSVYITKAVSPNQLRPGVEPMVINVEQV